MIWLIDTSHIIYGQMETGKHTQIIGTAKNSLLGCTMKGILDVENISHPSNSLCDVFNVCKLLYV